VIDCFCHLKRRRQAAFVFHVCCSDWHKHSMDDASLFWRQLLDFVGRGIMPAIFFENPLKQTALTTITITKVLCAAPGELPRPEAVVHNPTRNSSWL